MGTEGHASVDLALRYLGLEQPATRRRPTSRGECARMPWPSPSQRTGRPHRDRRLPAGGKSALRRVRSDAPKLIEIAHNDAPRLHVDGAFGLWAAASPTLGRRARRDHDLADSWATDAHKTLNVPCDCGIAVSLPIRLRCVPPSACRRATCCAMRPGAADPIGCGAGDVAPRKSRDPRSGRR